jgi:hypothetical protein
LGLVLCGIDAETVKIKTAVYVLRAKIPTIPDTKIATTPPMVRGVERTVIPNPIIIPPAIINAKESPAT